METAQANGIVRVRSKDNQTANVGMRVLRPHASTPGLLTDKQGSFQLRWRQASHEFAVYRNKYPADGFEWHCKTASCAMVLELPLIFRLSLTTFRLSLKADLSARVQGGRNHVDLILPVIRAKSCA